MRPISGILALGLVLAVSGCLRQGDVPRAAVGAGAGAATAAVAGGNLGVGAAIGAAAGALCDDAGVCRD